MLVSLLALIAGLDLWILGVVPGGRKGLAGSVSTRRQPLLHRFLAWCGCPRLRALPQHGDLGVGRILRPARDEGNGRRTRAGATSIVLDPLR
jgi:hypothetical protein